ncbi:MULTISPECIES: ATP-binding protein [unclassified Paraburkholderia]|uniref:ATP-binding protein n=1 Tax=unclassified Paraburkholderia TaxID=2615204 RepID=UPI002AAFBD53|nr:MULTISPECIES: ATP-binding protein [unclassified Paraburkholderia]
MTLNGESHRTILLGGALAGDEAAVAAVAQTLAAQDCRLLTARDGAQARALAQAARPDLILLDEDLLATCRELKHDEATREIPVILVLSAGSHEALHESIAASYDAGAADHLLKPVCARELAARVSTQLALARLMRPVHAPAHAHANVIDASSPVALCVTAMPGGELLYANEPLRQLLRLDEGTSAQVNIVDFYVDRSVRERLIRHLASEGNLLDAEVELRRRDGTQLWALANARVATYDDVPAIFVGLYDISGRKQIEQELVRSREQQRELFGYFDSAGEDERKRSAFQIQDEVGQLLTALKMDVSLLRMRVREDADAISKTDDMRALVERSIWTVRNVASHLRPAALNFGIASALEWLAEDFSRRHAIACELRVEGTEPALSDMRATVLFRIVESALDNVARHAGAQRVQMSLANRNSIDLTIRDDGCGFNASTGGAGSARHAYGLLGMAERARLLDGTVRIDSALGKGTTVSIHIPLEGTTHT